ncbi:MAG: IS66 family transposase [Chloroflexi bacterium]|nr:IS66 family transposase [Chloroflexota bacterium]
MERAEAEAIYEQGREAAVGVLLALSARIDAQDAQIAKLVARVEELERRLSRNSQNSSTPPSQDPPGAPERKRGKRSGRKQGGQPGHPGHGRPLFARGELDRVIDHWPERCGCGHCFSDEERNPCGSPARHQVAELPAIAVELVEHRLQRLRCPECGERTTAPLPVAVPAGAFGPRLEAAVATLSVRNRLSRRDLVELLDELFGCALATGTVDAILQRTAAALAAPYESLRDEIQRAASVNVDETGWRLRGGKRTLWGAFSEQAAVFRIAPDRHEREARALLGERFAGIVGSDRWWAYNTLDPANRQVCWSHLIRDFTFHAEGSAAQKQFGEAGLAIAKRLFESWEQFQDDGDREALIIRVAPLKRELHALLLHGSQGKRQKRTWGLAKNLLKIWPALWTFTTVPGVEPTNNAAERGLRGAVIYRKLSLGSQSHAGERMIERLLSVSQTCRLQRRSLFAYLADVLTAKARDDPVPLPI